MANFRKGAEAIASAATRKGGGNFTPTHKFESGETKYLQFLQPIEDIVTVLMHRFIIVGYREDGSKIYENFISRKDPGLDGAEGYDPLWDRFGNKPSERSIALAVELEPIWDTEKGSRKKVLSGFEPAMREYTNGDGDDVVVPNVALVIESPYTFFNHLGSYSDIEPIEEGVFAVKRTGADTNTQYTLMKAGDALDIDDLDIEDFLVEFDFDEYLDELSDEEKVKELIDPLDDDWVVNEYAKKGKGGKPAGKAKAKPGSTRTRKAAEPEPDEPEADEPEADEPEAEAKPRSRRFDDLKAAAAAKRESK